MGWKLRKEMKKKRKVVEGNERKQKRRKEIKGNKKG